MELRLWNIRRYCLSPETTFSEYATWWLERRKNDISASYYVNCEMTIELTKKYIGGYKLREITSTIIQQYYDKNWIGRRRRSRWRRQNLLYERR